MRLLTVCFPTMMCVLASSRGKWIPACCGLCSMNVCNYSNIIFNKFESHSVLRCTCRSLNFVVQQRVLGCPGVPAAAEQCLWCSRSYHTGLRHRLKHGHRHRSVTHQSFSRKPPVTCLSVSLIEVFLVVSVAISVASRLWSSLKMVVVSCRGDY